MNVYGDRGMKARSAKAKGTKLEKWVVTQLERIGIRARRQPGSGIYDSFPHDAHFLLPDGDVIVEAKSWKNGWRTGDRALGKAQLLVIKRDYAEPCVYMPWDTFERLVKLADAARIIA